MGSLGKYIEVNQMAYDGLKILLGMVVPNGKYSQKIKNGLSGIEMLISMGTLLSASTKGIQASLFLGRN